MHVVLSGSTGSKGSHLLHHLVVAPGVTKIYCLNRAKDGHEKQMKSKPKRALRDQWNPDEVKFIHIDISQPKFGMDAETYKMLSDEATHFIRECIP
jgi:thioester reductase-like protein